MKNKIIYISAVMVFLALLLGLVIAKDEIIKDKPNINITTNESSKNLLKKYALDNVEISDLDSSGKFTLNKIKTIIKEQNVTFFNESSNKTETYKINITENVNILNREIKISLTIQLAHDNITILNKTRSIPLINQTTNMTYYINENYTEEVNNIYYTTEPLTDSEVKDARDKAIKDELEFIANVKKSRDERGLNKTKKLDGGIVNLV